MADTLEKHDKPQHFEGDGHSENHHHQHHGVAADTSHGFAADSHELGRKYFLSPRFIGSFFAVGFNLMASTGGFAMVAPVLGQINAAVGPSVSIIWLSLVYTICLAIGLLLVGRLSDIFGRRWFFIGGTLLGVIGSVISATGNSVDTLIGGQTLIGLSACTGYSYAFVSGELVPIKYRFLANAIIFVFSLVTAGFGAAISTAFILYTSPAWRLVYWFLFALNGFTCLLYTLFYFPPSLADKHGKGHAWQLIKNFDFIGAILFVAGLILFILGLSSGGSLYPWNSARVISFIVIGFVLIVALFLWEIYAKLKEPLIPMHWFKMRGFLAPTISLSLGASTYYSQAIIFPALVANVYADGRLMWAGWTASLVGIAITMGEVVGGAMYHKIGYIKYQCIVVMALATLFLGLMALTDVNTPAMASAFVFWAVFFVGWNEALVFPIVTFMIPDQGDIGAAIGAAGSARSAISTVASTIYSVVLTERTTNELTAKVPAALLGAGLPAASVEGYMTAVAAGGTGLTDINGVTPDVISAGSLAYREAYVDSYRTIYYISIGFGILTIIANVLVPNIDHLMTTQIATKLHGGSKKKRDVEERKA